MAHATSISQPMLVFSGPKDKRDIHTHKKKPSSEQAQSRHVLEIGTRVPGACVLKRMDSKSFKPSREELSQLNQSGW